MRIFKLITEFGKGKPMYSIGPKSGPRPQPSRGGGRLWATGRNSRMDRSAWPSPWVERPGGPCRLGALVRVHGQGHRAQDRRGCVAEAACRWHVGQQGPRESIIEGRASRRARTRVGNSPLGWCDAKEGGVGRSEAFAGGETLR
jgi:hypothetical protein